MSEFEGPNQEEQSIAAPETGDEDTTSMEGSKADFIESEQMLALKELLIEAGKNDPENFEELQVEWRRMADEAISQLPGQEYDRATIGMIRAQAAVWKELAETSDYNDDLKLSFMFDYTDDLNDALEYAENMGFEDVIAAIQAELNPS